jgi:hypothetical protein
MWGEKYPDVEVVSEVSTAVPYASWGCLRTGRCFTGVLFGSVSHALLHCAHCRVAIVPSVDLPRDLRP